MSYVFRPKGFGISIRSFLLFLLFAITGWAWAQSDDANYRLSANDMLDFRVFQEDDMASVIRIAGDGSATFPLLGSVQIGGKTVAEAIDTLRAKYKDGYLVDPQITITIREYSTRQYTVLGQVQKPGSYSLVGNEGVSLLQAIGMAGGYTRIADPGNVTVKRRENGQEKIMRFNAKKMARGDSDTSFVVRPGDVITVGESIF